MTKEADSNCAFHFPFQCMANGVVISEVHFEKAKAEKVVN